MFLLAAILSGLVVDQTGAVITNATIEYLPGRSVQTDMTGRFTTPNLPAGIYGLRISAPAFVIAHTAPATITLTNGTKTLTLEDAEGIFRFDGISPGTYTLRA